MASVSSTSNPLAKRLSALRSASRRDRGGLVLLEGVRLCEEALAAGLGIEGGFRDPDRLRRNPRGAELDEALDRLGIPTATPNVIDRVSDTVTSQGVVLAVREPGERWPDPLGPIVLLLDGIRDPGNIGTILRSAAASGMVRVVAAIDCADLWGAKAVRAGLGAHFRLSLATPRDVTGIRARTGDRPWLVAEAGDGAPYESIDWSRDYVLVIGGEAEGASSATLAIADQHVTIPIAAESESLNAGVAASIILFEAARQLRAAKLS